MQKTLFGNTAVDQNVILDPRQVKSAVGNNGMFDMTNPNIYKSLVPIIGAGAYGLSNSWQPGEDKKLEEEKFGGNVNIGDEVDEATMQRLMNEGYTFEEI